MTTMSEATPSRRSPLVLLVMAVPLGVALLWWLTREDEVQRETPTDRSASRGERSEATGPNTAGPLPPDAEAPDDAIHSGLKPKPTTYPMGKVERVKQTEEFTYLLLREESRDRWVAVPRTELVVGAVVQVEIDPGAVRENFPVKSLDRVFPELTLARSLKVIEAAPAEHAETP